MTRKVVAGTLLTGAVLIASAGPANAGTPGPTVSLGSAGGFEYLKSTFEDVVSQAGAGALCDGGDSPTGGGGTISGPGATAALNASHPFTGPPGDGWQAEGSASDTGRRVTTYVICGSVDATYNVGTSPLSAAGQIGDVVPLSDVCGPGENALAGFEGEGGDVRFPASYPSERYASWAATARNFANTPASATQYANCFSDDEYKPKRRTESAKIPPGKAGKVTARCKSSEAAIAGGFLAATSGGDVEHDAWVTSTRPFDSTDKRRTPDDGWTARAQNDGDAKVTLTVYAGCQPK